MRTHMYRHVSCVLTFAGIIELVGFSQTLSVFIDACRIFSMRLTFLNFYRRFSIFSIFSQLFSTFLNFIGLYRLSHIFINVYRLFSDFPNFSKKSHIFLIFSDSTFWQDATLKHDNSLCMGLKLCQIDFQ